MVRRDLTLLGPIGPNIIPGIRHTLKPKEREPWVPRYRRLLLCIPLLHRRAHLRRRFASVQSMGRFFIYWHFRESECPQPDWLFCSVGPPAAGGTSEVLVEDAVVEAGKRMGLKEDRWTSMAGYAWVWVFTSFSLVYSVDELKNPAQAGYLTGEGMGALATLIGVVTDRVFGVQLAQVLPSLLSRM